MTQSLNREYRRYTSEAMPELQPTIDETGKRWPALATLTGPQRLQILHDLCSFQLANVEALLAKPGVRDLGATWRVESVGQDRHGVRFWFLADCWLYTEKQGKTKEEQWECVAWDVSSWQTFLSTTSLATSRRPADKQLLAHLRDQLFPIAEPLLMAEEKRYRTRLKKEQAELQRLAFLDTRKRSSRLTAKAKIREEMLAEMRAQAPPKRPEPMPEKRPMTREERMALRRQKIARVEERTVIKALFESAADDVDVEEPSVVETETEDSLDEESALTSTAHSPIRLVVRMGPSGPIDSKLFIGDETIERKEVPEPSSIVSNAGYGAVSGEVAAEVADSADATVNNPMVKDSLEDPATKVSLESPTHFVAKVSLENPTHLAAKVSLESTTLYTVDDATGNTTCHTVNGPLENTIRPDLDNFSSLTAKPSSSIPQSPDPCLKGAASETPTTDASVATLLTNLASVIQ